MARKGIDKNIEEIKKLLKAKKIILGTKRTMKLIKSGSAEQVFLSSNCPEEVRKDIEYYAKITNVPVVALSQPNDELGILCKKPFPVSVLCMTQ